MPSNTLDSLLGALTFGPGGLEMGSYDQRDTYLKCAGVPYFKLTPAGLLSPVNGGIIELATASVTNAQLDDVGAWTAIAHAAGNYTGSGTQTWTVALADQLNAQYAVVGKTCFLTLFVGNSTVGGAASTTLRFALPAGIVPEGTSAGTYHLIDNGTAGIGLWTVSDAGTTLNFFLTDFTANWAASTDNTSVRATAVFRIE